MFTVLLLGLLLVAGIIAGYQALTHSTIYTKVHALVTQLLAGVQSAEELAAKYANLADPELIALEQKAATLLAGIFGKA
jgi:hypothetical protein